MRDVLVPVSLAESCSLPQALRWIARHEYPLADGVLQGWTEIASGADAESTSPEEEGAREHLFGQLVTGNIAALGCLTDREPPSEGDAMAAAVAWTFFHFGDVMELTRIPRSAWSLKSILWDRNALRTPKGLYIRIRMPTETLLKIFPEPAPAAPPGVEQRGRTLLVQASGDLRAGAKPRGRPREYDWDLFHTQVAKVLLELGGLPKVKADLVRAMQDWCAQNWKKEPADSAIRNKLALYYAVIGGPISPKEGKA